MSLLRSDPSEQRVSVFTGSRAWDRGLRRSSGGTAEAHLRQHRPRSAINGIFSTQFSAFGFLIGLLPYRLPCYGWNMSLSAPAAACGRFSVHALALGAKPMSQQASSSVLFAAAARSGGVSRRCAPLGLLETGAPITKRSDFSLSS